MPRIIGLKALSIKTVDVNDVEKVWSVEDYNGSGLKGDYHIGFILILQTKVRCGPIEEVFRISWGYIKNRFVI
jgi:hypothetical protein